MIKMTNGSNKPSIKHRQINSREPPKNPRQTGGHIPPIECRQTGGQRPPLRGDLSRVACFCITGVLALLLFTLTACGFRGETPLDSPDGELTTTAGTGVGTAATTTAAEASAEAAAISTTEAASAGTITAAMSVTTTAPQNASQATLQTASQTASEAALPSAPQTTPATYTSSRCTLNIHCETILANMDKLAPEKISLVPEDGVIYYSGAVEFEDGDSVFDILLRETKREKIHFEFVNTPALESVYIKGINNIYEFDCGELSGWTFKVNGESPGYGCAQYRLAPDDDVEIIYTCDLGADIDAELET